MTNNEPIPVSLALRAVERAIRECGEASAGPWAIPATGSLFDTVNPLRHLKGADARFAVLARAGFRGTLEYIKKMLGVLSGTSLREGGHLHAVVAPIIAHYDRVSPGWRTE